MKSTCYLLVFIFTTIVICSYMYGYTNTINLVRNNFDILSLPLQDDSDNWMKMRETIYSERNERISKVCQRYKDEYNIERNLEILNIHTLGHGAGFILDRKNKIGYCENPKVGTSTWMNYFFWLLPAKKREMLDDAKEGVNQEMRHAVWKHFMVEHTQSFNKFSLPGVSKNFDRLVKFLNDNIFTFIFVRHPFERLVSAYKNKGLQGHLMESFGYKDWYLNDHSFPAFVDLVLSEYRNSSCYKSYYSSCNKNEYTFNYHWSPLTSRCSYCEVSYNVIGHMETFDEDVHYIVSKTELNKFFPAQNYTKHLNPTKKNKENETLFYFRQLSAKQFHDLYDMYQMDFDAFGYDAQLYLPQ